MPSTTSTTSSNAKELQKLTKMVAKLELENKALLKAKDADTKSSATSAKSTKTSTTSTKTSTATKSAAAPAKTAASPKTDLSNLTKDELMAYAAKTCKITLVSSWTKAKMLEEIEEYGLPTADALYNKAKKDGYTGTSSMTKEQLHVVLKGKVPEGYTRTDKAFSKKK